MTSFRQLALRKARKLAPWTVGSAIVGGSVAAFGFVPTALVLVGGAALSVVGGVLLMAGAFLLAAEPASRRRKTSSDPNGASTGFEEPIGSTRRGSRRSSRLTP